MTDVFPTLRPGWTFNKAPQFKNQIQRSISGRELRIQYQTVPTWLFTLTYEILADEFDTRQQGYSGGTTLNELRTLLGFYLAQQGTLNTFLFTDPTDYTVTNQNIGTGNGSTTTFQLVRTMGVSGGEFNEPIIAPNVVSDVYVNGVVVSPGDYSVNYGTGVITFTSAPGSGLAVTATFTYYFVVRFSDDSQEFENFAWQLWQAKTIKLQSVLL